MRILVAAIGHVFGVAEHPTDVAAGQGAQVLRRPPSLGQGLEQPRIPGHIIEPLGQQVDPVVVAAEPDVLDPRDLAHVLAVGHHVS